MTDEQAPCDISLALYKTLRFAVREAGMDESSARALFDRGVHCLPSCWQVVGISHGAADAILQSKGKPPTTWERPHLVDRNIWQRQLLRRMVADDIDFEEWAALLAEFDRVVVALKSEHARVVGPAFLDECIPVPKGLFRPASHSSFKIRYDELNWLSQAR